MNFEQPPHVWNLLAKLASDTSLPYREMLSHKQMAMIKFDATRLERVVPTELFLAEIEPRQSGSADDEGLVKAPQAQAAPDTAVVMADLLDDSAQAKGGAPA
jgi:hypothetical protein